ncbi:MAG: biofilm regulation protein phosphatase SiaA [Dechloromonas sp.]|nr:biofilm regulation protein phosphatase SiaA [Dechloromonas sp.]
MPVKGLGLRTKSMLALLLACVLALLPAGLLGWKILEGIRQHFGEAYASNLTELKRQTILAPVLRDLALSRRLAGSLLTRQWLIDEDDLDKKRLFFSEAEAYRQDLGDHAYFVANAQSQYFYANDDAQAVSDQVRYVLERAKADDSWFFSTLARHEDYNINVNYDAHLKVTRVWLNVLVRDSGGLAIGVAGAGIDLTRFLADFLGSEEVGVTPMIINRSGAIQAHRDQSLIATNQAGSEARPEQLINNQLDDDGRARLKTAMLAAEATPGRVQVFYAQLGELRQLLALAYIPELKWHVLTAVDLQAAQVLDENWLQAAMIALVVLVGVLLLAFGYAVEKLLLQPVRKLQLSALAMGRGEYDISLPPAGHDELGDLSRVFGSMVRQIRDNTANLEEKVQLRTQALEAANRDMQRAHRQINDSIDYASLIQRAILPDQQLKTYLGKHHFVLWRPRDVVGGDFYVFRQEEACYLLGVIDCAGHGVPGALMTMLARSALDHAMSAVGINRPAAILSHTDQAVRGMLQHCDLPRAIATNMDAGLVVVDRLRGTLRYAGAKITLYWSDGQTVGEIKGGRRALGDRRPGEYVDSELTLRPGVTYYLATDGFLDQAGGELGYGFGNTRFAQVLLQQACLPMAEQAVAFDQVLAAYQGTYPQRDDITILSFRFD